jgi:transcriptional regulator with XRE-family HTH domain
VRQVTNPAAPNRLRALRLARGWTQQDVSERLHRLAWSLDQRIGVTPDMIAKWERATKRPSPRYRQLLAQLFHVDQADLGLDGRTSDGSDDESLASRLDRVASILNQLGPAGRALRPHVLATLTEDMLSRHSVATLLDTLPPAARRDPTECSPTELTTLAEQCEALYGTVDPAALLTAVSAQIRAATSALSRRQPPGARQRLTRARARLSVLAGRLAQDSNNTMAARAYYAQAADDAQETSDGDLAARAAGYAATLAFAHGHLAAGLAHLRMAAASAVDPDVRRWVAGLSEPSVA